MSRTPWGTGCTPHCSLQVPNPKEDPELAALVAKLQTHSHRPTCQTLTTPRFEISEEERETLSPEELKQKEQDSICRLLIEASCMLPKRGLSLLP